MDLPWGRSDQPASSGPFSVLTVCEGNICRSPLAEQILRARFAECGVDAVVSSAGLGAMVGSPMDTIPAEISRINGGSPDAHRGRQLRTSIAHDADLIVTMTRAQRDTVVQRYPKTMRKAFSLVELARLLSAVEAPRSEAAETDLAGWMRALAAQRATIRFDSADDILDPYLLERTTHELVGNQIALSCARIAHAFAR